MKKIKALVIVLGFFGIMFGFNSKAEASELEVMNKQLIAPFTTPSVKTVMLAHGESYVFNIKRLNIPGYKTNIQLNVLTPNKQSEAFQIENESISGGIVFNRQVGNFYENNFGISYCDFNEEENRITVTNYSAGTVTYQFTLYVHYYK